MARFTDAFPTPLERQFMRFYNDEVNQYAHLHKNNAICLIGLSPTHPAVAEGVVNVEFGKAASTNEAVGKRKRGALGMRTATPICTITTKSGSSYLINACVNCDLVEINQRLKDQPGLVSTDPEMSGFLCVGLVRGEVDSSKFFPNFVKHSGITKFIPKSSVEC